MAEKIYSEIPMRTWRWLGVNEAKADEAVLAIDNGRQELVVPAGESRQLTVVYRQAGEGQVQVKVEKGGFLKLTTVQLLPVDAQGASSIQVELADTAELEAVAVEAIQVLVLNSIQHRIKGSLHHQTAGFLHIQAPAHKIKQLVFINLANGNRMMALHCILSR